MIGYLVLGLVWLALTTPFAILIGRCISVGQAGDAARIALTTAEPEATAAEPQAHTIHAEGASAASAPDAPDSPAQRQPALPVQRDPAIAAAEVS